MDKWEQMHLSLKADLIGETEKEGIVLLHQYVLTAGRVWLGRDGCLLC